MSNETRILRPHNIIQISQGLKEQCKKFLAKVEEAISETTTFAVEVSQAIGDISIYEAEKGIIDFFFLMTK